MIIMCVCGARRRGGYVEWSRMEWKMKRLNEKKYVYFLHPNGNGQLSYTV